MRAPGGTVGILLVGFFIVSIPRVVAAAEERTFGQSTYECERLLGGGESCRCEGGVDSKACRDMLKEKCTENKPGGGSVGGLCCTSAGKCVCATSKGGCPTGYRRQNGIHRVPGGLSRTVPGELSRNDSSPRSRYGSPKQEQRQLGSREPAREDASTPQPADGASEPAVLTPARAGHNKGPATRSWPGVETTTSLSLDDLPLPDIRITRAPDTFPEGRQAFHYVRVPESGGKPGPVRVELWLREHGKRNATPLDVLNEVPLGARGIWEFDVIDVFPSCPRQCFLILRVKRGTQERSVQMPLIPVRFTARKSRASGSGGSGELADYALTTGTSGALFVGREITVDAEVIARAGRRPPRVRDVAFQLWIERRGNVQLLAALADQFATDGKKIRFQPKGFKLTQAGGTLEVRALKGRTILRSRAELLPFSYRVGPQSRVRDRR